MAATVQRARAARSTAWQAALARRFVVTDLLAIIVACTFAQTVWIRDANRSVADVSGSLKWLPYSAVTVTFIVAWFLLLTFGSTRDRTIIGSGNVEYRRIVHATIALFGTGAAVAYLVQAQLGRGYFLTIVPVGLVLLVGSRYGWRLWVRSRRRVGEFVSRTVVLGHSDTAEHFAKAMVRNNESGLQLVGAVLVGSRRRNNEMLLPDVPVLDDADGVLTAIADAQAEVLVVADSHSLSPKEFRRLGWELEDLGVNLVVASSITDIAGPRLHARPVAGLPLIYIDFPSLAPWNTALKRAFDIVASLAALIIGSPVFLAVAVAIALTSRGPVFYTQERIGRGGKPFRMLKFRSMIPGADEQLQSLLDLQGTTDQPLFKVNDDPRITPVGRFIRKHSLDELPQLLNVLIGDMSLVGPRPQVAKEVELYDDDAHRRHRMKPGMSGLWQINGRSRLTWDDALRFDLYYVENWSFMGDIAILWRTVKVVAFGDGAA
ncbi:sugar transferase [Gryllotalpicola kribbensis]|uniref:Sugar transferase n=2 Tax=Gryllotalpicola kribbensis TaxID=993084 RepID=A0ABP8AMN6_9MICO